MATSNRARFAAVVIGLVAALCGVRASGAEERSDAGLNEWRAMATLLDLAAAQDLVHRRVLIDCDGDGIGEYATLRELAGGCAIRSRTADAGAPPSASVFASAGTR